MPDIASIAPLTIPAVAPAPDHGSRTAVAAAPSPPPPRTPDALQRQLDDAIADADTSLRFRVDDASGRIVVAVLDTDGRVLLQIPDETALAVARHLARTGTLLDLRA